MNPYSDYGPRGPTMKKNPSTSTLVATLLALAIPVSGTAQESGQVVESVVSTKPELTGHHRYKLIDLGTFGGPNSSFPGSIESINPSGTVTGVADTSFLDPDFAIQHPFFGDPYIEHSYVWKHGHRTALPVLRGGSNAEPQWINGNGSIVGFSENGQIDPLTGIKEIRAVIWDPERRIHDLGTLGGNGNVAWTINDAGQVAGDSLNDIPDDLNASGAIGLPGATQTHSFLWQNGVMYDLGTLGGTESGTYAINERGQVVGLSSINSIPNPGTGIPTIDPFFWDGHKMIDIGSLGGTIGVAVAVNNRGQVTGSSNRAGDDHQHAFLWPGQDGKIVDLGTLGGSDSEAAMAINDSGYVTGAALLPGNTEFHAVLWGNGGILDLGVIPGDLCDEGMSLNSRLQVVGYSNQATCHGPHAHGFLWEHGVLFDLNRLIVNDTGLQVIEGVFINERGEITANAVTPEGNTHAVVLIPCNESHPNIEGCDYSLVDAVPASQRPAATAIQSHQGPTAVLQRLGTRRFSIRRP